MGMPASRTNESPKIASSKTAGYIELEVNMAHDLKSSRDVIIRTQSLPEAVKFYSLVLGLPIIYESKTLVGLETGSFCLYIEKGDEHGPVFEFLVRDVQTTKQNLVATGCKVIEENPAIPRCYIRDPFGLVFNIGQAPVSAG